MMSRNASISLRCCLMGVMLLSVLGMWKSSQANEGGYAPQQIIVPTQEVKEFLDQRSRLDMIALRIAGAADSQCANRWRHPGFKTHKLRDYPRRLRRDWRGFGLKDPHILSVQQPDLRGQIQPGDQIIDSRGQPLDDNSLSLQIQLALGRLTLVRDGERMTVEGHWPQICYRPVRLTSSFGVEARTTPNAVELSRGLVNYTRSDDELAYAIAHELSHFMLDHSDILSAAREEGRLSQSLRRALETDADRGAVFLMHKAGYDLNAARSFIERSSVLRDVPMLGLSSHPSRSQRLNDISETIAAIHSTDIAEEPIGVFVSRFHR